MRLSGMLARSASCPVESKNPKRLQAQCVHHGAEGRALGSCRAGVAAACYGLNRDFGDVDLEICLD